MKVDVGFFLKIGIVTICIMMLLFVVTALNKDMELVYIFKVNGRMVFKEELDLYKCLIASQSVETMTEDELYEKALNRLIRAKVVEQEGKTLKLAITRDEENQRLTQLNDLWLEENITPVTDEAKNLFSKDIVMYDKVYNYFKQDGISDEEYDKIFEQKVDEWISNSEIEYSKQ